MFKKLHRQMTIFSALITSGILILMAIASLVIFERGLTRNSYERFLNNGNSCVAYLETQSVLSHKWILEAKQKSKKSIVLVSHRESTMAIADRIYKVENGYMTEAVK